MDLGGLVLVPMMTFATPLHTSHTHNTHQRFKHVSGLGLEMSWNTPDEHSHDDTTNMQGYCRDRWSHSYLYKLQTDRNRRA